MSIDTAARRNSALIDVHGVLPIPDGTIDSSDRLTLIGQYGGIAASSTAPIPVTSPAVLPREFRLYRDSHRIYFPDFWVDSVDFELLERGGYGQATIHALATWEELALVGEERLDVYLWGELMYRGYVRIAHKAVGTSQEARPTLYGHMERCNGYQAHCRYAYGSPVDLSTVFSDIVADHVAVSDRLPNLVIDSQTTGVTIDRFDGTGKSVTQAFNSLCDVAPNQAIWGFDVDASGNDRIYLRPRSTSVIRRYSIGGNAVAFDYPVDLGQIVNTAYLKGGKVTQPNLLKDGSFENPLPNSETNGNLLGDYSFENGVGGASLAGGATRKGPGDHGGARTGSYWVELDTPGEAATWTVNVDQAVPLVASFWARRETGTISRHVRMRVEGLDVSSAVVATFYLPDTGGAYTDPGSETYVRYNRDIDFTPYATVTQARVVVETNEGSAADDGIDADDVALYEKSASPGAWTYALGGAAKRAQLEWQVKSLPGGVGADAEPVHGCYAILAQASNISSGSDYMDVLTSTDARVEVRINNPYTFSIFYRTPDATTTFPDFEVYIRQRKSDGTVTTETFSSAVTVATIGWTLVSVGVTTNSDTATIEVGVRLLNGTVTYFDGAFLCYGSLPSELTGVGGNRGYWEGDTYERLTDVTNTAIPGLSTDAAASIDTYGVREAEVNVDSVVDWDTAKVYLEDYFNAHATPEIRGTLRVIPDNADELLTPTGTVKLLNLPSTSTPSALYATRVRYSIGEGVDIDADIGNAKPDTADYLRLLEERAKRGL